MELKYQVYINGSLSQLATERLLAFNIEDNSGLRLDSLELSINNADQSLETPNNNSIIELAIGYDDNLYKMGEFIAQYVDATTTNINIKAIAQDLGVGRIKKNRVFKNKSLEDILKTLAGDLGLVVQVDNSLKTKQIGYYLQESKTSLEVLAELSEIFYAIANIKDGSLVFVNKENTKVVEFDEANILTIKKEDVNNKVYAGVVYNSWNVEKAKLESLSLGKEPYLVLANKVEESIKNSYINSKYSQIQEKQVLNLTLQGDPQIQAGFSFNLKSAEFNGNYRIERVTHRYDNTYVTSVLAVKTS